MSPTLEHADVVLIDCGRKDPVHDRIFAIEEDNAVSIKRLHERHSGAFWIVSDNRALQSGAKPIYPPRRLSRGVRIIGRMIWSARTWV
jgi:phage repressor protein C with HTH and peptisase S24 domain